MKGEFGDKVRLQHMLDAIGLIEKALERRIKVDFENDFILQAAIERWLQVVGEAAYKITKSFKSKVTSIEWKGIEGLRHIIVHEYMGLDLDRIWVVTQ
ncbi:MAG TPA: HepT-like ribonuclease domain-containing protein [Segetibacter sp.]|jgi:uncharacterized protein with HEPN domain